MNTLPLKLTKMTDITVKNFNIDKVLFMDPVSCTYTGGTYFRIPLKYDMGTSQIELTIPTNPLKSYGIFENKGDLEKKGDKRGPVENYSVGIGMEDEALCNIVININEKCKNHLVLPETKRMMKKFNMTVDGMKPMSYQYNDKGEIKGSPSLFPRLYTRTNKTNSGAPPEITTDFYDADGNDIDPKTLIRSGFNGIFLLHFRDIYIGSGPSLQIKVKEAIVLSRSFNRERLLINHYKPEMKESVMDYVMEDNDPDIESQLNNDPQIESQSNNDSEIVIKRIVRKK